MEKWEWECDAFPAQKTKKKTQPMDITTHDLRIACVSTHPRGEDFLLRCFRIFLIGERQKQAKDVIPQEKNNDKEALQSGILVSWTMPTIL